MIVLVFNCGSSSVKFQLFDMEQEKTLASGLVERIGMAEATLHYEPADRPFRRESPDVLDHTGAVEEILAIISDPARDGVVPDRSIIGAVGHRVVHGGEWFSTSARIDEDVIGRIRECVDLAPLHNPHNLKGIAACQRILPTVPQVAVFDTAFHQSMPRVAYIYALPYVLYKRHKVRRYGFHGQSHSYVYSRVLELLAPPKPSELRVITCHLGNGASLAAIRDGQVLDTSMGMTPLEGLVMGTRSGDIDPALVLHIMGKEELTPSQATTMMNKHSGLYGISGVSSDMREVIGEAEADHTRAQLALDVYCHRLRKYVGAYAAVLGGLDALVFTGGVGSHSALIREQACQGLQFLGVDLDETANAGASGDVEESISKAGAAAATWIVPTNEELVIARDTVDILSRGESG